MEKAVMCVVYGICAILVAGGVLLVGSIMVTLLGAVLHAFL